MSKNNFSRRLAKINSMHVCDMVDVDLSFGEIYFPDFPIPEGETSVEYFERLAWDGLRSRYGDPLPKEISLQS